MARVTVAVILLQLFIGRIFCECRAQRNDTSDWRTLLSPSYQVEVNPRDEAGGPTQVFVALEVIDIVEIDQMRMHFTVQAYLSLQWNESRLNFEHFSNHTRRLLPEAAFDCFWRPSAVFSNNIEGSLVDMTAPNRLFAVYSNGTVHQVARYNLKIRCLMNLMRYPMDIQNCDFEIRLFDEPDDTVQLRWLDDWSSPYKGSNRKGVTLNPVISPLNFRVSEPVQSEGQINWLQLDFTVLRANMTLFRRLTPYLITTYVPAASTVALSMLGFWIDAEAVPGRVMLGVTTCLSVMTQMFEVRKPLPTLNYITALDIYLFVCLVTVSLTLLEYTIAFTFMKEEKKLMDMVMGPADRWVSSRMAMQGLYAVSSYGSSSKPQRDKYTSWLDHISKLVFPVAFLTFNIAYWIYYYATDSGFSDAKSLEF